MFKSMKHIIISLIITIVSCLTVKADTYSVDASSLNVRDIASQSGNVMGQLTKGQMVEVKSIEDGWATIDYLGKNGYVKASYLTHSEKATVTSATNDGPTHKFFSIFSNKGEAPWFSIVKWILIVGIGIILVRYGLSLLYVMIGFGVALGAIGLAIGGVLYWMDWIEEITLWSFGRYGFYTGCVLAIIYRILNIREWTDDANSVFDRTPTTNVGADGLKRYTVYDEYGHAFNLKQEYKNSESYKDQYGKLWYYDNSGFHRL